VGDALSDAAMGEASVDGPADVVTEEGTPYDAGPGWQVGDASVPVDTLTDGGLPAVECIGLITKDLVVDPTRSVLYASMSASAPLFANNVVRIDPTSVAVTGTVFVGSGPNALATTDDGASLYVGDDGTATVCRVDLASGGVYDSVSLGLDQLGDMVLAGEIRAVPGSATQWVVIENGPFEPPFARLALYDGTTMLAQWAPPGALVGSIAFISSTILYGYNSESTGDDLYELSVGSTGFTLLSDTAGLIQGVFAITSQGGWIFATDGQAVYGATAQPVGQYPATGSVWPDPNGTDVWILQTNAGTTTLFDFGRSTFVAKRSIGLPAASGATSLVGWSSTGLAFRTPSAVCIVTVP